MKTYKKTESWLSKKRVFDKVEGTSLVKYRKIACEDCGCAPDAPMLEDAVWLTVAKKSTLLCCTCLENRLGRPFTSDDLTHVPMNGAALYILSRSKDHE